jgi:aminopeptidase
MSDPRLARLGELIVGYSLGLQPGKVFRIDTPYVGVPLAIELYRAGLHAGALPYANVEVEQLPEILVREGSEEQLDFVPPMAIDEVDRVDAIATNRRWERISAGELSWSGVLCPTAAHAQDAEMSLSDYESFVFRACHVEDEGDAVAHWQSTSADLQARAEQLGQVRELRIVAPDTDLRIVVEGRTWEAADGRHNMPDGEVYTSPLELETEGEIRFSFPAVFQGREVDDIRLRFEEGSVVASEAVRGGEFLEAVLGLDDGARRLGEVAFGMNYEIDRFTKNILFDEKIGGTMHVALGSAFKELGGVNDSALHWDLVCDLRAEGEVYADGELVWRAGRFLEETAPEPVR